jgi:hypothetical protein
MDVGNIFSYWCIVVSCIDYLWQNFRSFLPQCTVHKALPLLEYDKCSDYVLDLCTLFPGDIITKVGIRIENSTDNVQYYKYAWYY